MKPGHSCFRLAAGAVIGGSIVHTLHGESSPPA